MNRLVLALLGAALATAAVPAAAQEARPQLGVGISIVPLEGAGVANRTVEVYLPINLANKLRIEPSLGIFSADRPAGSAQGDTRDFTLGVGVFGLIRVSQPVDLYAGGRLKLNFAHVSTAAGSDSGTDVILAAAFGGEYYLVPHFSLGLEGQLGFYSNSAVSGDDSGVFTTGLAFLRVYF